MTEGQQQSLGASETRRDICQSRQTGLLKPRSTRTSSDHPEEKTTTPPPRMEKYRAHRGGPPRA
eukprot:348577-Pyramimonas_sp.AAC.1